MGAVHETVNLNHIWMSPYFAPCTEVIVKPWYVAGKDCLQVPNESLCCAIYREFMRRLSEHLFGGQPWS